MEKLSREQERAVVDALKEAVELVNGGSHPTDALFKVASGHSFSAPLVQRMAEALNTSKTLSYMKNASPESRGDSFPLADAHDVLMRMYPETVQAPAEKAAEVCIPAEYFVGHERSFMKTSEAKTPIAREKIAEYPPDQTTIDRQIHDKRRGLVKKAEATRSDYRIVFNRLLDCVDKMACYFKELGHEPFELVEKKAYACYGEDGLRVMDIVYKHGDVREKRGSYQGQPSAIFDSGREPYYTIALLMKTSEYLHTAGNRVVDAELALEQFNKKHHLPDDFARPKQATLLEGVLSEAGEAKDFFPKAAVDIPAAALAAGGLALGLKDPSGEGAKREALSDILDPEHEAQLHSVAVRAMLNDFVSNDPILSSYHPHELTTAYNHIAQLAPQTARQPAVMRGMLRKVLQQGGVMEPFEAQQLSDIERKLSPTNKVPEVEAK